MTCLLTVLGKANSEAAGVREGRLAAPASHTEARRPQTQLYEAVGTSVVAYALSRDGLPATKPDWQLTGGLRGAVWLGFDGAGDLYVSDEVLSQVRIYAPGASSDAQPVRTLVLPGPGCALAVNAAGTYLRPSW
jgi:hypothetical protein